MEDHQSHNSLFNQSPQNDYTKDSISYLLDQQTEHTINYENLCWLKKSSCSDAYSVIHQKSEKRQANSLKFNLKKSQTTLVAPLTERIEYPFTALSARNYKIVSNDENDDENDNDDDGEENRVNWLRKKEGKVSVSSKETLRLDMPTTSRHGSLMQEKMRKEMMKVEIRKERSEAFLDKKLDDKKENRFVAQSFRGNRERTGFYIFLYFSKF